MSSHRTRGPSNSCGPEMDGQWVNTRKIGISLCPQVRRKWGKVSNLVYQPTSLPPSPEAAADATTLRDLQRARALAAAPPRPEEKAADPADPSPAGSGPATQTPGTKARGVCSQPLEGRGRTQRGRAGERGKALTLPCRAPLSRLFVLPLRGRSGTRALREAAGLPRRLLWGGCWAGAVPRLPSLGAPRAPAPPLRAAAGPRCALGCRVLGDCGVLGCGARRRATPLSRAGGGAGRGAGAATSQPGIRPSARPQDPEPPPPNQLTSGLRALAA